MIQNATLRKLRGDRGAQRRMSDTTEQFAAEWRSRTGIAEVLEEFKLFAHGRPLGSLACLKRLLTDCSRASAFADGWVGAFARLLAQEPLADPFRRYKCSAGAAVIQLASEGEAELSLVCFEGNGRDNPPQSGYFDPTERHEIVLAGSGSMLMAVRDERVSGPHNFACTVLEAKAGTTLSQYGSLETRAFGRIDGRLVLLRLARNSGEECPAREYRYRDGALLHQASSNKHESCREMMVTLLGKMGRKDALPAIAHAATGGPDHLRWQALRQCLALDTGRGFELLCKIAGSPGDSLAAPAGALRAQLIEAHPQLARLEKLPCHS